MEISKRKGYRLQIREKRRESYDGRVEEKKESQEVVERKCLAEKD